jgi:hypothetical protein
MMQTTVKAANDSLVRTPYLLQALKDAGVVDAGGLGFVLFFEGMVNFLKEGKFELPTAIDEPPPAARVETSGSEFTYRYCTEGLVSGKNLERAPVMDRLRDMGDCLLVAGGGDRLHVHIHTDEPDKVFAVLEEVGQVSRRKVDDMIEGARSTETAQVGILVDSTFDIPREYLEAYGIQVIPLQVLIDDRSYKDEVEISREEVMRHLLDLDSDVRTSQASPGDFAGFFEEMLEEHEKVLVMVISSGLSGTLKSAQLAASAYKGRVEVFDSLNVSLGSGALAIRAAQKAILGWDVDRIRGYLEELRRRIVFLCYIDTLAFLIRGGRVSKIQGELATLFHLKPILAINETGELEKAGAALGANQAFRKIVKLLEKELPGDVPIDVSAVYSNNPEVMDDLERALNKRYRVRTFIKNTISPVLLAHGGPGAWGLAVLPADVDQ